jgi:hypothetical protein
VERAGVEDEWGLTALDPPRYDGHVYSVPGSEGATEHVTRLHAFNDCIARVGS